MKVKIGITLTSDEYTKGSREIQVQIEESIPEGFQDLGKWEQDVRKIGFKSMRELFKGGIELYEEKILSEYTHKSKHCHLVKRGTRAFTLKTVVGGVRYPRQRMYCRTCNQWVIPLNEPSRTRGMMMSKREPP